MARYDNILQTIGNTPLVRLNKLAPAGVNVYVKVESFNPMGSVKDRMARAIIEDAERSGALKPGMTVIEATSGNMKALERIRTALSKKTATELEAAQKQAQLLDGVAIKRLGRKQLLVKPLGAEAVGRAGQRGNRQHV